LTAADQHIPVNLITGFLGVGKTTAVQHLLDHQAAGEKWAVLVNEFGEVGIDGILLSGQEVMIQEVAGGCLCCVAAPAFTTGLNRLIRRHRPNRILIEPSGLGHPAKVLDTLRGPLYAGVLEVRATICLMDARHLASTRHREHPNFQDQIHLADVLVANKVDLYAPEDFASFEDFVVGLKPPKERLALTERGRLDPQWLDAGCGKARRAALPEAHAFLVGHGPHDGAASAGVARDWVQIQGAGDGYRRVGWIIRQHAPWPAGALRALLDHLPVERKKGVFNTEHGWRASNQNDWRPVEPPTDGRTRLELIDPEPIESDAVDRGLRRLAATAPDR
jgi:G3E family GTPase